MLFRVLIIFILIYSTAYANCIDHKAFMLSIKQQLYSTSIKNRKDLEHIYEEFLKIIQNNVDLKGISRFVIGKHWKLSTQKEKEDFLKEYEIYLARLCVTILYKHINNSEMIIMSTKVVENETCLIETRLSYGNEKFTNIDFKVIKSNSSFLINDVVMSGISIAINQRSQFNEKIDIYGMKNIIDELKYNNNL